MTTAQIFSWLIASLIGFVAGYLAGRVGRDVSEHHPHLEGTKRWSVLKTLFGLLLLALVGWSVYSGIRQADCQADFNEQFSRGIDERVAATDADREANNIRWGFIREAVRNPVPQNATLEQRAAMGRRWVDELDRADQLVADAEARRRANPFPVTQRCER